MIDPALDKWVWATALLLLIVLGARAWVVETGQGRLGRTPVQVRVLTVASIVVLAGLSVLLVVQGGAQLVESLITGSDPAAAIAADPAAPADPADPAAPADPGAPADPADPVEPAAPADPAAPAG